MRFDGKNLTMLKHGKFVHSFEEQNLKSRRKIVGGFLTFSVLIISWSILCMDGTLQFNRENPYVSQNILDRETISSLFQSAIQQNENISVGEKRSIQMLLPYFQENPYLEYEKVSLNLATLKIYYEENYEKLEVGTVAEYFPDDNIIRFYSKDDVMQYLPHEVVHATGGLRTRFMCEGLDSILVSEYLNDGKFSDGYIPEIYLTSIIIEFAGSDAVLEAFSKHDDDIFIRALEEKLSHDEVLNLLETFENYARLKQQFRKNQISVSESVDAFLEVGEILIDYVSKMDLDTDREAYVYSCFLNATKGNSLPKFCYNREKDWGYSTGEKSFQETIDSFKKLVYRKQEKQEEAKIFILRA